MSHNLLLYELKFNLLWIRANQNNPIILDVGNNSALMAVPFLLNRPVKVMIHGLSGSKDSPPNSNIRPAYFQKDDYNVIALDYGPLVPSLQCYLEEMGQMKGNLRVVAKCLANLLDKLIFNNQINLNSIHTIGFSLGAHVAGMTADVLLSGKLTRITGLDPAGPGFQLEDKSNKLDSNDALFVDVLHTDKVNGLYWPLGDVDFFANFPLNQPACGNMDLEKTLNCNHGISTYYFAESINTNIGFYGVPFLSAVWSWFGFKPNFVIFGEYTPSRFVIRWWCI